MKRETLRLDALIDACLADQDLDRFRPFPVGDHLCDDVPTENVKVRMQVGIRPLPRSLGLRDVPGPYLIRMCCRKFGCRIRSGILLPPVLVLSEPIQNAVHRAF